MAINVKNFPVMKKMCPTCPFRHEHEGQIETANMVKARCMTRASQICHHPSLHGKKQDHLCRGARQFQITMFYRLGIIDAETDEAWVKAREELGV